MSLDEAIIEHKYLHNLRAKLALGNNALPERLVLSGSRSKSKGAKRNYRRDRLRLRSASGFLLD